MNRQQRRGIMKELRTFMESISGRKFKTLMESFRAGVAAILEADDEGMGVVAQDISNRGKVVAGISHPIETNVFAGLMKTAKEIKKKIKDTYVIDKNLKKIIYGNDKNEKDYNDEIRKSIKFVEEMIASFYGNHTCDKYNVSDDVIKEICSHVKSMNSVVGDAGLDQSLLVRNDDIINCSTFSDLRESLHGIKDSFSKIRHTYNNDRKNGFAEMPSEYVGDTEVFLSILKDSPKYKAYLKDLQNSNISDEDKKKLTNVQKVGDGDLVIPEKIAGMIRDEISGEYGISKSYMGTRIKDDDFAAATLLFYSIAAKKQHLKIQHDISVEGAAHTGPGTPRENIALALYVLLGKTSMRMKRWIISRAPGIDWQNFETAFKFKLVGYSQKATGSSNMNVYDLGTKLPKNSLFVKAIPGGKWVPGAPIEDEEELNEEELDRGTTEQNGDDKEKKKNEADEKKRQATHPNKNDFTGGMSEEELKETYGGWIEKNGEYYVPRDKRTFDGTGDLVGKVEILQMYDKEGYLTATRTDNFGKGSGLLEICYNQSDLVPKEFIEDAERIYNDSIKMAELLLKFKKSETEDGGVINTNITERDIINGDDSKALCIFYSYVVNEGIVDSFKIPLYDSASKIIYNIVRGIQSEAKKNAPDEMGVINVPLDNLNGRSSRNNSYNSGSAPERDPGDIIAERQERGGSYEIGAHFEAPGKDIAITVGDGGIQKLPKKYRNLLGDIYYTCETNPGAKAAVAQYFLGINNVKERDHKIQMYKDILNTAGLPEIMSDDDGNNVLNTRKDDFYDAVAFFNTSLLTEDEVNVLNAFVDKKYDGKSDETPELAKMKKNLESAIKKINSVLSLGKLTNPLSHNIGNGDSIDAYSKLVRETLEPIDENGTPTGEMVDFDLRDIINRYNARKEEATKEASKNGKNAPSFAVNGVEIGVDSETMEKEKRIMHEIEASASDDVSGIIRPLIEKMKTIENGVAIQINPGDNIFGIGRESFGNGVVVFGKIDNATAKSYIEHGKPLATVDGPVNTIGDGEDFEAFPPVQNYRNLYDDAVKNTTTYASVVGQIYSLLVYLSEEENIGKEFKVDYITTHLADNDGPIDDIQRYLTKKVCEELSNSSDVSGSIADPNSGIRKFLDNVLEIDQQSHSDEPGNIQNAMENLREAYVMLCSMLITKPEEANPKAYGYLEKLAVRDGDKQTASEKEFNEYKENIFAKAEQIQEMIPELAKIKESRDPNKISYGDLIYLMLCGGLGLTNVKKKPDYKGSYYDAFLDLVDDYKDLANVSERISRDVCGEVNERIKKMAAATLLLILSIANNLSLKHYSVISDYEEVMNNIDEEKEKINRKMKKAEKSENTEDNMTSMEKLMERYDELVSAENTERKRIIGRLKATMLGIAENVIKSDFNTVINGITKKVSFENGIMDIESVADYGELLLDTIAKNPTRAKIGIKDTISSFSSNFSRANKYIDTMMKKDKINDAVFRIISEKNVFKYDTELSKYHKEYELANERAINSFEVGENGRKKRKPVKPEDILEELNVITNDQIKDALTGKEGFFTDEYIGSKRTPLERAEAACKAIMLYLMKRADLFDDGTHKNEINVSDFENMMRDIRKDSAKQIKLAGELNEVYNASDSNGSIRTFVDAINSSFGKSKRHGVATAVLTLLVDGISVEPSEPTKPEPRERGEKIGLIGGLPEEYAKVAIIKVLNLTPDEDMHISPDIEYDEATRWLRTYKNKVRDSIRRISLKDDSGRKCDAIIKIAEEFIDATAGDEILKRSLYHMCVDTVMPIVLNKVIDRMKDDVKDSIIKSIRLVYGKDLKDKNILRTSGILDENGNLSEYAISRMAAELRGSITGTNTVAGIDYIVSKIKDRLSIINVCNNMKIVITNTATDLGEIIYEWQNLISEAEKMV